MDQNHESFQNMGQFTFPCFTDGGVRCSQNLGDFAFTYASDCLCGLMVKVPGYRSGDSRSVPGAIRFSEK
jgi:hypothetical protein